MQACNNPSLLAQIWTVIGIAVGALVLIAIVGFILAAIVGIKRGLGNNKSNNDGL